MEWVLYEDDIKKMLLAAFDVKSMKFDDKKKCIIVDIVVRDAIKELKDNMNKMAEEAAEKNQKKEKDASKVMFT